jgi:broad specificity polyphosphatase/5'/3'-nucleotidase SurE
MGHAITTNSTLYLNKISENDVIEEYSCRTPVDCVKLAVNEILKESRICACLALIMDLTLPSM